MLEAVASRRGLALAISPRLLKCHWLRGSAHVVIRDVEEGEGEEEAEEAAGMEETVVSNWEDEERD